MQRIIILSYALLLSSLNIYGMEQLQNCFEIVPYQEHEDFCNNQEEGLLAGTLVKVPFGYTPIEELEIGDRVISRNTEGILETDFVVAVERRKIKKVVQITVAGQAIIVADGHKFFTPLLEQWIKAYQISCGDKLLSFPAISTSIESIEILRGDFDVITISIASNHNYFVSEQDLLVHNMNFISALTNGAKFLQNGVQAGTGLLTFMVDKAIKDGKRADREQMLKRTQEAAEQYENLRRQGFSDDAIWAIQEAAHNPHRYRDAGTSPIEVQASPQEQTSDPEAEQENDSSSDQAYRNRESKKPSQSKKPSSSNNGASSSKNPDPDDDKDEDEERINLTDAEKKEQEIRCRRHAKKMGWVKERENRWKHPTMPRYSISPDRTVHKGGYWKLMKGEERVATLDWDLNIIAK